MNTPVGRQELETLYQTSALVHLVDGNAAATSASVVQALIINPDGDPLRDLGPNYAKLHKNLSKAGILRTIDVSVVGAGNGYLSGVPIQARNWVRLAAGKHQLQVQRGERWVSQVVWLDEGSQLQL